MATTFGTRPEDTVADSRGNVVSGVAINLYPTEADATARTSLVASVQSDTHGLWPFSDAGERAQLWARDPAGRVWPVTSNEAFALSGAGVLAAATAAQAAAESAADSAAAAATLVNAPADAAMAAVVGNPASATAVSLSSTFAPVSLVADVSTRALKTGNGIALLGDSITDICSGGTAADPDTSTSLSYLHQRGYWTHASQLLGHRLNLVKNAGVSGERTDQMRARVSQVTTDLAAAPRFVVVMGGTNDLTAARTTAQITTDLDAIYAAIIANGSTVVACTIVPKDTTTSDATQKATRSAVNQWIRLQGSRPGLIVCDWSAQVSDATTGGYATGMSYDGTHPTALGASIMGKALADALTPALPGTTTLISSNADPTNMVLNGMMLGTAGGKGTGFTGSNADNWSTIGTAAETLSKVARTDGIPGEWLQRQLTGASTGGVYQNVATGWAVGDQFYGEIEYQTDAASWGVQQIALRAYQIGATGAAWDGYRDVAESLSRPAQGVLRTPPFTVLAGATAITLAFYLYGSGGTARFARAALKKV